MELDPFELAALRQRRGVLSRPPSPITQGIDALGTALGSDISRLGTTLYDAAASIPGLVGAHQAEYSPGMSVRDMPQTMEKLPEAALNIVGTPAGPTGAPGTTLTSGMRVPKLLGAYHGTGALTEFEKFRLPPSTHDLGIHATIDPWVAEQYAWGKGVPDNIEHAGRRIKPVLLDVRSALRFPEDAIKWNNPDYVIEALRHNMKKGFEAPRGLLSDMYNVGKSPEMWQRDFVPMLEKRGYDAMYYPHVNDYLPTEKYNTFMMFDPERVMPRFSKEGQKEAAWRGIHEPMLEDVSMGDITKPWQIPRGVLADPGRTETLKGPLTDPTLAQLKDPMGLDVLHNPKITDVDKWWGKFQENKGILEAKGKNVLVPQGILNKLSQKQQDEVLLHNSAAMDKSPYKLPKLSPWETPDTKFLDEVINVKTKPDKWWDEFNNLKDALKVNNVTVKVPTGTQLTESMKSQIIEHNMEVYYKMHPEWFKEGQSYPIKHPPIGGKQYIETSPHTGTWVKVED